MLRELRETNAALAHARDAAETAKGAWEATGEAVRAAAERSREIATGLAQDITGPIKEALKSGEFTWETFAGAIEMDDQSPEGRAAVFDLLTDMQATFTRIEALRVPDELREGAQDAPPPGPDEVLH